MYSGVEMLACGSFRSLGRMFVGGGGLTGLQVLGFAPEPQISGQLLSCAVHHDCRSANGTWLTVMESGPEVE